MKSRKYSKNKNTYTITILLALSIFLTAIYISGCASASPAEQENQKPAETEQQLLKQDSDATDTIQNETENAGTAYAESIKITTEAIDTCQITIPGISREYDLLFFTDTHVIIPETSEEVSQEIRDYSSQRLSEFAGESEFSSSDLFSALLSYTNETKPDALLLGGDIIDSPSPANIDFLGNSLQNLETPYIYTPGNHDWTYPWEYMTETAANNYLPPLSPYMGENPSIHTLELDDFIIVAVDNSSNQINPNALETYKTILAQEKPVLLLVHVPFYTPSLLEEASVLWQQSVVLGGGVHGGTYPNDVSAEFMGLTTAKDSPVAAVIAGHVHFPHVSNMEGEKDIPQIVGDAGFKGRATHIHISP